MHLSTGKGKLPMKWMMFIKHLQALPLPEAAQVVRGLGFDGVDLTVRPGGSVAPESVRQSLPQAARVLHDWGLTIPLATTALVSATDPHARDIVETAASLGIREIKLGYVPVNEFGTYQATLENFNRELDGLEALARANSVRINIHLHSGAYLSSLAAAVWWLIKDRDPAAVGAYVDPGHMFVEGGRDGWRLGLDLLHPRIALVAVKDLIFEQVPDERSGKSRWVTRIVPLERGAVPWPEVFQLLKKSNFDGWVSVHSEYQGNHSWRDLKTEEVVDQTRQDLAYLRKVLAADDIPVPEPRPLTERGQKAAPIPKSH
jgi:sugar phosphate isomerase/epimerase